MKTNYKIGETYYDEHGYEFKLVHISTAVNNPFPLMLKYEEGNNFSFRYYTIDGRKLQHQKPTLSTSPTEFIAPKEEVLGYMATAHLLGSTPTPNEKEFDKTFISWEDVYKNATFKNINNGATELLPPPGEGKFYRIEADGVYIENVPTIEKDYEYYKCRLTDFTRPYFNTEKIQKQIDVLKAIDLLKENGYIITKQY